MIDHTLSALLLGAELEPEFSLSFLVTETRSETCRSCVELTTRAEVLSSPVERKPPAHTRGDVLTLVLTLAVSVQGVTTGFNVNSVFGPVIVTLGRWFSWGGFQRTSGVNDNRVQSTETWFFESP